MNITKKPIRNCPIHHNRRQNQNRYDFPKRNHLVNSKKMAELFDVNRPAITKHLKNIFKSQKLDEKVVSSILEHTTQHGAIKGKTQNKNLIKNGKKYKSWQRMKKT